jgi:hypothetical protein
MRGDFPALLSRTTSLCVRQIAQRNNGTTLEMLIENRDIKMPAWDSTNPGVVNRFWKYTPASCARALPGRGVPCAMGALKWLCKAAGARQVTEPQAPSFEDCTSADSRRCSEQPSSAERSQGVRGVEETDVVKSPDIRRISIPGEKGEPRAARAAART